MAGVAEVGWPNREATGLWTPALAWSWHPAIGRAER